MRFFLRTSVSVRALYESDESGVSRWTTAGRAGSAVILCRRALERLSVSDVHCLTTARATTATNCVRRATCSRCSMGAYRAGLYGSTAQARRRQTGRWPMRDVINGVPCHLVGPVHQPRSSSIGWLFAKPLHTAFVARTPLMYGHFLEEASPSGSVTKSQS